MAKKHYDPASTAGTGAASKMSLLPMDGALSRRQPHSKSIAVASELSKHKDKVNMRDFRQIPCCARLAHITLESAVQYGSLQASFLTILRMAGVAAAKNQAQDQGESQHVRFKAVPGIKGNPTFEKGGRYEVEHGQDGLVHTLEYCPSNTMPLLVSGVLAHEEICGRSTLPAIIDEAKGIVAEATGVIPEFEVGLLWLHMDLPAAVAQGLFKAYEQARFVTQAYRWERSGDMLLFLYGTTALRIFEKGSPQSPGSHVDLIIKGDYLNENDIYTPEDLLSAAEFLLKDLTRNLCRFTASKNPKSSTMPQWAAVQRGFLGWARKFAQTGGRQLVYALDFGSKQRAGVTR
jgi:hypothetical protein